MPEEIPYRPDARVIEAALEDVEAEGAAVVRTRIAITPHGITLNFEGFGDHTTVDGHGEPVLIEIRRGVPHVVVWQDINREDPTRALSLARARESLRGGEEPVYSAGPEVEIEE